MPTKFLFLHSLLEFFKIFYNISIYNDIYYNLKGFKLISYRNTETYCFIDLEILFHNHLRMFLIYQQKITRK